MFHPPIIAKVVAICSENRLGSEETFSTNPMIAHLE